MLNANVAASPQATHKILVVEDEVLIRWDVAETLRAHGYEVVEAASADEAFELIASGMTFDLVLSDVRMPGRLDGLALAKLVASNHPQTPIILTSGHLFNNEAVDAAFFVQKPFNQAILLSLISGLVRKTT
jgi:DNA-binding NtrC family response regulator